MKTLAIYSYPELNYYRAYLQLCNKGKGELGTLLTRLANNLSQQTPSYRLQYTINSLNGYLGLKVEVLNIRPSTQLTHVLLKTLSGGLMGKSPRVLPI